MDTLYINALSDGVLYYKISDIIAEHNIKAVIETGIGNSTYLFGEMVPCVTGIDNDSTKVDFIRSELIKRDNKNIFIRKGNSPTIIRELFEGHDANHVLFFLDAHWNDYWPLLGEIEAIPRGSGVIVIHDAKVPGTSLGYDTYKGQELTYEYVRDALTRWSPNHIIEYNDDTAEGPKRGVMIVYPGEKE